MPSVHIRICNRGAVISNTQQERIMAMTRKLLFAFFAAQVLYLQLHFTSGKLLMTIDYCAE